MRKLLLLAMVLALFVAAAPGAGARPDARPFEGAMNGSITFPLDETCPMLRRTRLAGDRQCVASRSVHHDKCALHARRGGRRGTGHDVGGGQR